MPILGTLAERDCMRTKFEGAQSRDHDFWGQKSAKSGQF